MCEQSLERAAVTDFPAAGKRVTGGRVSATLKRRERVYRGSRQVDRFSHPRKMRNMSEDKQKLKATYDAWSTTYDGTVNLLISVEEVAVRSLLRGIDFHDALDAATGTGRHALYLAQRGKRVAATDSNEKMLAEARSKARKKQFSIEFRQEDVSRLSFRDSSFDLVICALALAHVEDLAKPCNEFVRVLRAGGHLILSDLHPSIQADFGPDGKEDIAGERRHFPAYHTQVADYVQGVKSAGAEVVAAIDVPLEVEREVRPGALVVWARKPV